MKINHCVSLHALPVKVHGIGVEFYLFQFKQDRLYNLYGLILYFMIFLRKKEFDKEVDMKKKLTAVVLGGLLCLPSIAYGAKPTSQVFVVNNQVVDCLAYNIDGYNYFKLRDVLKGLNATGDKYNVRYHAADKLVEILPGTAYEMGPGEAETSVGGEVPDSQVFMGEAKVKINGVVRNVKSCKIAGYNYLQIRSLSDVLSKDVGYDEGNRVVHVGRYDAGQVKLPKKPTPTPQKPTPQAPKASGAAITAGRQSVAGVQLQVVTVPNDPNLKFNVVKGNDRLVGAEPFGSILKRTQPTVAVNGNFFDAYRSLVPFGNIVSKGQVIQGIGNDGAFVRTASGKNIVGQPTVTHSINTGHSDFSAWYTNAGLNDKTGIGVFNPFYGNSVKLPQGTHAVVTNGVVTAMGGAGNVAIPRNGYVIFFAANAVSKADINRMIKVGDKVTDTIVLGGEPRLAGEQIDALVAAGPILVKDGKNVAATASANYEAKIRNQNAGRSAIGVKADGTVVIVTGKATVVKLANAMIQLGCVEATNLDGGASSALYANGRVITPAGRNLNTVLTITK